MQLGRLHGLCNDTLSANVKARFTFGFYWSKNYRLNSSWITYNSFLISNSFGLSCQICLAFRKLEYNLKVRTNSSSKSFHSNNCMKFSRKGMFWFHKQFFSLMIFAILNYAFTVLLHLVSNSNARVRYLFLEWHIIGKRESKDNLSFFCSAK
jgi:hypothetical protein